MSLLVQCDCGKKYKVGNDKAGKKFRCRECSGVVAVPRPKSEPDDEWDDFGEGRFDDYGAVATEPKRKSRNGSQSIAKGRKKKSANGMSPAVKYSVAGGIVVVTSGIVIAFLMMRGIIGSAKEHLESVIAQQNSDYPQGEIKSGDGGLSLKEEAPALAFSPDGKFLAIGLVSGGIQIWDMTTRTVFAIIPANFGTTHSLAFSPDGRTLASGHTRRNGNVVFWDVASGKMTKRLQGHTDKVNAVAFSPDGSTLASAGADRTVRLWNASTGESTQTLQGHQGRIRGLAFSPHGNLLASCSGEFLKKSGGEVIIWNMQTRRSVKTIGTPQSNDIVFTPDGKSLVATDGTGLSVWSVGTWQRQRQIKSFFGQEYERISISSDGRLIAACGLAISTVIIDFRTGKTVKEIPQMRAVAFCSKAGLLAGGDRKSKIQIIDVTNLGRSQPSTNPGRKKTTGGPRKKPYRPKPPRGKRLTVAKQRAVDALRKLGGKVTADFTRVIRVDLRPRADGVTDSNLIHLKGLTDLQQLDLGGTRITDAGLAHLKGLSQLQTLKLDGTKVTGAGFIHLHGLTKLRNLYLSGTNVTDSGLMQLKKMPNLRYLYLTGTNVTDAGLVHLQGVTNLFYLVLSGTNTTADGVRKLQAALRKCRIIWRPKPTHAIRNKAQSVEAIRKFGGIALEDQFKPGNPVFQVSLQNTKITDTGMAILKGVPQLRSLILLNTQVTDAGLVHLKGLTGLQNLNLCGTKITSAGLAHLKGLKNLKELNLIGTKVDDAGLNHLRGLPNLNKLILFNTRVTAAGAKTLQTALPKCRIVR